MRMSRYETRFMMRESYGSYRIIDAYQSKTAQASSRVI
jgi:hypothetical protein